jgi:hypothetical protein
MHKHTARPHACSAVWGIADGAEALDNRAPSRLCVRAVAFGCRLKATPNWLISAASGGNAGTVQFHVREAFATLGIASCSQISHGYRP